jgi:signal transduction histidine kinase
MKLFRKFQKLQARPTDKESSTGLGLSIVKELVQALHGKISVESKVNTGSKFTVELPVG